MSTGRVPRQASPEVADRVVYPLFLLFAGLSLLGYAIWLMVGLRNGFNLGILKEALSPDGTVTPVIIRDNYFPTISGVTTCTQFSPAAVLLGMWIWLRGDRRGLYVVLPLVGLAALRSIILSERLALIEVTLPAVVIALRMLVLCKPLRARWRTCLQLAPLIGVVALLLFFGGSEYFRSWRHYESEFDSLAEFTVWRVGSYYTTAHNNGAMALETEGRSPIPYATLRFLWRFPGIDQTPFSYERLTGHDPILRHQRMLEHHGTPELNNSGGLFDPVFDLGVAGSVVYWLVCGFVIGRVYRSFLVGTLAGLTLYPLLLLAVLEVPRFLYVTSQRSFAAFAALLLVAWLVRFRSPSAAAPSRVPATGREEPCLSK